MKILIASSIDAQTIEALERQHDVVCAFNADADTLQRLIADREALIFRSGVQITADVMSRAPQLRLVLRAGSGVDNLDVDYVRSHDIELVRIPGPGARAVAEMSFGLMLALARNIVEADRLLRQGRWAKKELTGYLLTGKVLGVVGAGNIGARVGQLGAAWGMEVLGCVEHRTAEATDRLRQHGIRLVEFDDVLRTADFLSIHVPLKAATRNLIDGEALALVKPGAFLVNLARGGIVNESALRQALAEGRLRGAALDVHENEGEGKISPLAGLRNVILTPHIGAGTVDSQREIGEIVLAKIEEYVARNGAESYVNGEALLKA